MTNTKEKEHEVYVIRNVRFKQAQDMLIHNGFRWAFMEQGEVKDVPSNRAPLLILVLDMDCLTISETSAVPDNMKVNTFDDLQSKYSTPVISDTKSQEIAYIFTADGISLFVGAESHVISHDHPNFIKVHEAIKNNELHKIKDLLDVSKQVIDFGEGKLKVIKGVVFYDDTEIHGALCNYIIKCIRDGFTITPILNFLDNLEQNPSYRAVTELYNFLEVGNLPLTEDGCFVAYKKVRYDFTDIYTGRFDNSVNAVCKMKRNAVNEDSQVTCSYGLHACSYGYLAHFGSSGQDKVVAVKINPRDVVSIPVDYNNSKLRCCEYKVIADITDTYEADVLKNFTVYAEQADDDSLNDLLNSFGYDDDYEDDYED